MTVLGAIPPNDDISISTHATPVGVVLPYAGASAVDSFAELVDKQGWAYCQGQLMDTTRYAALNAVIGAAAITKMLHAFNGGVSPGTNVFRLPNLQNAIPLHITASGTGSAIGGPSGGGSFGSGWTHSHSKNTLGVNSHTHSVGSFSTPSHSHGHSLYEGGHTHGINSAAGAYWGKGGGGTNIWYDQTTNGGNWDGTNNLNGGINNDGGRGIEGHRLGSIGNQGLGGNNTGTTSGPGAPYLTMHYIIKVR